MNNLAGLNYVSQAFTPPSLPFTAFPEILWLKTDEKLRCKDNNALLFCDPAHKIDVTVCKREENYFHLSRDVGYI